MSCNASLNQKYLLWSLLDTSFLSGRGSAILPLHVHNGKSCADGELLCTLCKRVHLIRNAIHSLCKSLDQLLCSTCKLALSGHILHFCPSSRTVISRECTATPTTLHYKAETAVKTEQFSPTAHSSLHFAQYMTVSGLVAFGTHGLASNRIDKSSSK